MADEDSNNRPPRQPKATKKESIKEKRHRMQLISDEQLWDHLVAQGSYHRHQEERLQKHLLGREKQMSADRELAGAKEIASHLEYDSSSSSDDSLEREQRVKRMREDYRAPKKQKAKKMPKGGGPVLSHVGDARVYTKPRTQGLTVAGVWPIHIKNNISYNPDNPHEHPNELWDRDHGDGIHPIAVYSLDRKNVEAGASVPCWSDEEERIAPDLDLENPFRDLVHKAWERAVHAASTVVTTSPVTPSSNPAELPNAQRADQVPENLPRSRDSALKQCKELGFALDEDAYSRYPGALKCPSCQIVEFSTLEQLKDHYYGTAIATPHGCCWKLIDQHKRHLILQILEQDARTQADQLLELAFLGSLDNTHNAKKKPLDCFDLHDSLQKAWSHAVPTEDDTDRPSHLQTLQVGHNTTPIVLNQDVLDSILRRITERYSREPR